MNYAQTIAKELSIRSDQASATIELLDSDNTLPFIARYRKEATGGLDEEQIAHIIEMISHLRSMDERREAIISTITEQGKMTTELQQKITAAETLTALEDLYQPYRPKRKTRASIAKEKGLQGLADLILQQRPGGVSLEAAAEKYLSDAVLTVEDALAGARDIAAETISDHSEVRSQTRQKALSWGLLTCEKIEGGVDERSDYQV